MKAIIFAAPSVEQGAFVSEAVADADMIIAADCGAQAALSMQIMPEIVIGDLDSLDKKTADTLAKNPVTFITASMMKEETDTQLAVSHAIRQGATSIFIIGGVNGPRLEHTLANVFLTYNASVPTYLVNGASKTWIVSGPHSAVFTGKEGDLLSFLALSPSVDNIQTTGLFYTLHNESLYFGVPRGISNVFTRNRATIAFAEGMLLVTHTKTQEIQNKSE